MAPEGATIIKEKYVTNRHTNGWYRSQQQMEKN